MVEHQAKEVIDKISTDLKIQPALKIPRAIAEKIQLSYNINPERRVLSAKGFANNATSATILTSSSTKDTYLIGFSISVSKDAVSDSVSTKIQFVDSLGKNDDRFIVRYEPTTAGQFTRSFVLPIPFKIARNSVVQVLNSTATAAIKGSGTVYYYETDPQ